MAVVGDEQKRTNPTMKGKEESVSIEASKLHIQN